MRCFIALELDEAIKDRLEQAQGFFKDIGGKVGWIRREQMHLTLKFLGEVEENRQTQLIARLRSASEPVSAFEFHVEGLGTFPPSGSPRVLWVGIRESQPLKELHQRIEERFEPIGFPPENRSFTPHLTLGRVKERLDVRICREVLEKQRDFSAGTQQVKKVILFTSRLKPTGAVYTPIAEVLLKS